MIYILNTRNPISAAFSSAKHFFIRVLSGIPFIPYYDILSQLYCHFVVIMQKPEQYLKNVEIFHHLIRPK